MWASSSATHYVALSDKDWHWSYIMTGIGTVSSLAGLIYAQW